MEKKKQFIEFLYKQFTYENMRNRNPEFTVNYILTSIIRIADILGMKEKGFYSTSDDAHLDYYELLKMELLEMDLTEKVISSIRYAYRNYLEFLGNNPEPIARKRSYIKRHHHFKNKSTLENEVRFYKWIANDPYKKPKSRRNIIRSIKSGIKNFCKYKNWELDDFYTLTYKEIKVHFDEMFNSSKLYPFKLKSHKNSIKYSVGKYFKFLNQKDSINVTGSFKDSMVIPGYESEIIKKVVVNRKQSGEIVIEIY